MTPFTFLDVAIRPAMTLLPAQMDSPAARAMVIAIALQESGLQHRRQMGNGPARGYAQFEQIGVAGVLLHPASRDHALTVCHTLDVQPTAPAVWTAIEYHDVLAVCFSRLLLWTLPQALPDIHGADEGWSQYLRAWKPGKPRPEKWRGAFGVGWSLVTT